MCEIWIKRMVSWIIRHKMFYRRLHFYIKKPLALIARRACISMFASSTRADAWHLCVFYCSII